MAWDVQTGPDDLGGPFPPKFLESVEDLDSSELVTQGRYARVSQMAPHIYVMAAESCPLASTVHGE